MNILHGFDTSRPPVLFIGPELVKRYAKDLPSWRDVLLRVSIRIGMPKSEFKGLPEHDMPSTSTAVKQYLDEAVLEGRINPDEFLNDDELFEYRRGTDMFKIICASEMSWTLTTDSKNLRELKKLISLQDVVPAVFTTCTDDFLSRMAFPDFGRTTSISKIFPSPNDGIGELFMILGCSSDPDSLILTEDDAEMRRRTSGLLAARLISLTSEYPLLFIGYSPTDPLLGYIAGDMARIIGPRETVGRLLVVDSQFFETLRDPRSNILLETPYGPLNVRMTSAYHPSELFHEISLMKPRITPLELRSIKEMVSEITVSNSIDGDVECITPEEVMTSQSDNQVLVIMTERNGLIWKR